MFELEKGIETLWISTQNFNVVLASKVSPWCCCKDKLGNNYELIYKL